MDILKLLFEKFDESYQEYEASVKNKDYGEVYGIQCYLLGLADAMTVLYDNIKKPNEDTCIGIKERIEKISYAEE